jgi:RHS repeat-associated protein
VTADFGYTGFYQERAVGLDLTWYRAYDTEKGRWLSRDPLENNKDINLYEYVRDNPLRWIDPLGLWEVPPPPPGGTGCYQKCVKAAKDAEDDCEKKLGLLKAIFPASAEWVKTICGEIAAKPAYANCMADCCQK